MSLSGNTRRRLAIGSTATLLAGAVVFVLSQAWPPSEATRLRNALLMRAPDTQVGRWRPNEVPAGFLRETASAPPAIAATADKLRVVHGADDVALARAVASHLVEALRDDGSIRSLDVDTTYREIISAGHGYCADVIDAFVALTHAAGLFARTWAFSFDGFGGHGHIVAEVFDRRADRWVMLDVFNNVMPVDANGASMSVERFRQVFSARERDISFVAIGPGRPGFPIEEKLRAYYRAGLNEWYFWNGNNVVARGQSLLVRAGAVIAEPVGELAAIALGLFPAIVPLVDSDEAGQITKMQRLGVTLIGAAIAAGALALLLVVELVLYQRYRHRAQA